MKSSGKMFSKFILLDHMDWMSSHNPEALAEEWSEILAKSAPNSKAIFRSAGIKVKYLDQLKVDYKGARVELGTLLKYDTDLAARLHPSDRVHTYASFYIAELPS
jgi:S-adenosylmethionine-diacylglycerol 3-amino-3-carboxypropyl transferase